MRDRAHVRDVLSSIGRKSIIATVLVFMLTVIATFVVGVRLYDATKESIVLRGELNAKQSAMSFDRYLLVRKNTVLLASNVVNNLLEQGRPTSEILDYLVAESKSIQDSIDKDYTGLYGWVAGEYLDGVGWVPDEDYIPMERPWYVETMADDADITFVSPYLDEQTHSIMMTLATKLKDGESVLSLDISLEQIQEITEGIARQTPDSYCIVLNKAGKVIAHSETEELGKNYLEESGTLGPAVVSALVQGEGRPFEVHFDGQTFMVYAERLEGGWYCASLVNTAEFYQPLKVIFAFVAALTVLEALVFLLAFYRLGEQNLSISIQNVQLGALGDVYLSIQDIDLRDDGIRLVRGGHDVDTSHTGAQTALIAFVDEGVDAQSVEAVRAFTDLTTLPGRLADTGTVAVEYQDADGAWCRARFVVAEREDGIATRVLWLRESIDEERRQRDRLKALSETDPMTGVRSKHAYLMREKELDGHIASGDASEFSVVVCDVNGLKKVNDTYGHKAGDDYIREACRMVSDIFQHSPVFRVGGDEFTVVLTGRDHAIRRELMAALHERSCDHITAGGAVVSGGLSDFRPGEDGSAHDVFQRADERMYVEKKALKELGAPERDDEVDDAEAAIVAELDAGEVIQVRRHVLVVDDEAINREILGLALEGAYEVVFASDGYEALEQVRLHKDELALVLLDLIMPRLSGIEVLRTLKADEVLKKIPVIVLTADQNAELECLNLGAMDFIPKPYPSWEIIRARVNKCIELSEDRDLIRATARDSLTGLFNVDYFLRYVSLFDKHYEEKPMDAVVVDVNRFHMVNERHGRAFGDTVLRRLGERVRTLSREIAGVGSRRGADTFLIYCPHQEDYAAHLAYLSENLSGSDSTARVKLRMGVYTHVDKSIEIERRFDFAGIAADSVQGARDGAVGTYDEAMRDEELRRERLLEDFRPLLEAGCFEVYLQPKYDIRGDAPVLASAEALVRWQHPELGMISPAVFIPLLEENGMVLELDHFVWREAARAVHDWKQAFGHAVPVSVNVSRIDMLTPDLRDVFSEILDEFALSTDELLLEITESAYTEDSVQVVSAVRELRDMGLRIEMDDFGTGYSSLGMLSNLPIDVLKLDMSFVRSAFGETRDTRMIELVIDIARYLHVPVVAEGVETEEQYLTLKEMGCDYIQGYYFSKPVPAREFDRFFEA